MGRLLCRLFGCRTDELYGLPDGMTEQWCHRCWTCVIIVHEGEMPTLDEFRALLPHVDWDS